MVPARHEPQHSILTGERSRLLVLDIDPRNGGDASFERFERTFRSLPDQAGDHGRRRLSPFLPVARRRNGRS
jgi:hypothetical protein